MGSHRLDHLPYSRPRGLLQVSFGVIRIAYHNRDDDVRPLVWVFRITAESPPYRWVQASLNQKQRLQQLFFPDGCIRRKTILFEPL